MDPTDDLEARMTAAIRATLETLQKFFAGKPVVASTLMDAHRQCQIAALNEGPDVGPDFVVGGES